MKSVNSNVDRFLTEMEASLSELSTARRQEILDETRGHLDSMLAARLADGMDETSAWESVRTAFGAPDQIGQEMVKEWRRAPRYETVGTPLTPLEKFQQFGLMTVRGVAVCLTVRILSPWMEAHHFTNVFLIGVTLAMVLNYGWRHHKKGLPFKPITVFSLLFPIIIVVPLALKVQFQNQLKDTAFNALFDAWIGPGLIVTSLLMMIWAKRSEKTTLPWRWLDLYPKNPVGAEQMYRLSPIYGMFAGALMGVALNGRFLSAVYAPYALAILVLLFFVFRQWIAKTAT